MFCDRLRATRMYRGYTLQKTADQLLIPLRTYQNYEQGARYPHPEMLVDIADLFDVSLDFLLERDDWMKAHGVSSDVSPECPPRRPRPRKSL